MFPPGHAVSVYPALTAAPETAVRDFAHSARQIATSLGIRGLWLLAYQTEGGGPRLLLVAEPASDRAGWSNQLNQLLALGDLPYPVWQMDLADLPSWVHPHLDGDLRAARINEQ